MEKILLSPKSLAEIGLNPSEASLSGVVKLLSTQSHQRTHKDIAMLQALTKNIKFFMQKIEEIGEEIHSDSCRFMTYEFVPAGEVMQK